MRVYKLSCAYPILKIRSPLYCTGLSITYTPDLFSIYFFFVLKNFLGVSFSSLNSADFVDGNDDKSIIQQKQLAKYFENHKIKVEARKEQKRREIAQKKLLKK